MPHVGDSVNGVIVSSGTLRLAEDHGAGGAQAAHDLRVGARPAPRSPGAARGDLAGDVGVVLDRDRHAQQRAVLAAAAARVGLRRLDQRALGEHDAVGVERRVDALDPVQEELGQLARSRPRPARSCRRGASRPAKARSSGVMAGGTLGMMQACRPPVSSTRLCRDPGPRRVHGRRAARRRAARRASSSARARGVGRRRAGCGPQWAVPVALAALLGAAGSLAVGRASPLRRGGRGRGVAALCAGARGGRAGPSPLRLLPPRRATQNVVAPPAAAGRP